MASLKYRHVVSGTFRAIRNVSFILRCMDGLGRVPGVLVATSVSPQARGEMRAQPPISPHLTPRAPKGTEPLLPVTCS